MAESAKANIEGWKARLDALLHDKNSCLTPVFEQAELKTGVKRLHLALGKSMNHLMPKYMKPSSTHSNQ